VPNINKHYHRYYFFPLEPIVGHFKKAVMSSDETCRM
ncbi:hypothetical protein SNEBB_004797, partial [Seison nebaliae]